VEGDKVTRRPTGERDQARSRRAEIVNENSVDVGEYREAGIRQLAMRILSERGRISERRW